MREVIKNATAMLVLLALAIQAAPGLISVETRGVRLPILVAALLLDEVAK